MKFSRTLAVVLGLAAPALETVRRWNTWREFPPGLFDDYVLGALLLAGAWLSLRRPSPGQKLLAAAWGFACGLGYYSFFEQLRRYQLSEVDPAPVPPGVVVVVKGLGLLLAIAALGTTLCAKIPAQPTNSETRRRG